ncbi:HOMEOBOX-LEUCINE ZIPPER PROTEIN MERISTEM L1 [Salix koriyanagi]|uniref:HOMEOBOX-LEUCINE ZIPPER PROTEIN MERISTEM L1 n=1 Tax=Salix koriyanagi TaxID=2511006 RepID=A0A9Q0Q798_9ROSI|nr:HOMEOBOX-LEUCINE ZIPPER PROTEIN MERISTEM L1 [Salix koriyanagi]KAJ6701386.1 HOMEOBOX-LEUCINE ZIPPER PROTEIN MERISTEM L1 [Salix koriyanagi]
MFGDCQVMSKMGGNVVSSDTIYSLPVGNPNFNFMSSLPFHTFSPIISKEDGLVMTGKEEMESGSGCEQLEENSGNEQESSEPPPKKKRYHRHTERQIQQMEAMFKECPHPDDKQRKRLSHELGLHPRQVKFWFQNRRTQMKAQHDRSDNTILRAENESLKNDNYRLQAELRNLFCPDCGGQAMLGELPFEELRLEHARLREELERVCSIASRYGIGRPIHSMLPAPAFVPASLDLDMSIYSRPFPESLGTCTDTVPMPMFQEPSSFPEAGMVLMEEGKGFAMGLALSSMDELVKMCHAMEPLWIKNNENGKEVLNLEEHARIFPWPSNRKQNSSAVMKTEATRDCAVVIMNSINLVDAFLDANKWMELFPSIVARAKTVQVITTGVCGASGSLHLMYAELQVLSPLVPTRETYFLRFCQQNVEEGTWAIVDFALDSFHDNTQSSFPMYRRRPSGCVIQDLPNGYSRLTWIEHAEIEDKPVHQIFGQYIYSGVAFGAHRWLAVLQRQCERVASLMARNISDLGVIPSPEARVNMMRLAQRMIRTFGLNISTSSGQSWTALPDSYDDTVRITTRKTSEPGQPHRVIISAVSTTWLPYPHFQVFDLLRDEHRRSQLEILSNGNALHEVAHIANGSHPGNCISLLRINVASNSSQHVDLMLQESCTDQSGSLVVFTTVDVESIQLAMSGEDPSCIPLLPLGFVIVPVESSSSTVSDANSTQSNSDHGNGHNNSGCLLTVGLQVLANTIPSEKLNFSSVTAINNHLCNTVNQITAALSNSTTTNTTTSSCLENGNAVGSCNEPTAEP